MLRRPWIRRTLGVFAVLALVAVAQQQQAAQAKQAPQAVVGAGKATCAQFNLANTKSGFQSRENFKWASGYMSALNMAASRVMKESAMNLVPEKMDRDAQQKHILKYCGAHPKRYYRQAVLSLFDQLRAENGMEPLFAEDWQ